MNQQRVRQWAGLVIILAGLVVTGVSARMGNLGVSMIGSLSVILGTVVYITIRRYGERIEEFQQSTVDFTTAPAAVYSLIQVLAFATLFAFVLYFSASTGIVPSPISGSSPSTSLPVILIGVVAGSILGAGYPIVIQSQTAVEQLNVARIAFGLDNALTIGTYVILLFGYDSASAVFYAISFVLSRVVSLTTIYTGIYHRKRTP